MQQNFFVLLVLFSISACTPPSQLPSLVLYNGNFFTADSLRPHATAVAIRGESILFVGDDTGAKALAGAGTELVDLQGAFAMPGFIEGHGHFLGLGASMQNLNLMHSRNWAEIVDRVAQKAKETPPGEWIEGRGWHQEKWDEPPGRSVNGYPYHDALSEVTPQHPVVLRHASGHGLLANARAMQLAGISRETFDPIGGRIVRDASGNLTGVFEENAMDLIDKPLANWKSRRTETEKQAAFDRTVALAAQACLAKGITSFQDAGSDFWEIEQYRRLAENGKLPLRLWVMIGQPEGKDYPRLAAFPQVGVGNGYLTVRAVKAYLDGALGSYGAWLLEPYTDKPGHFGQNTTPVDTIRSLAQQCRKYGLQLCVHAIGDRANREVLDIYASPPQPPHEGGSATRREGSGGGSTVVPGAARREGSGGGSTVVPGAARREGSGSTAVQPAKPLPPPHGGAGGGLRWRIEHAQHIDPADFPRFRELGVIAAMQAIHCTSDAPFVVKRLGETRARSGAYAWRSLLDAGAFLANGTDAPVEDVDPLPCIYAAVSRKRADTGLAFFTGQKMVRHEALLSYTLWNAYAAFEEHEKGSLMPGKRADIIVLNKDLLHCSDAEILQAKVTRTYVGGRQAAF